MSLFFSKKNKIVICVLFGICLLCFIASIFVRRTVRETKAYYDRDDIILYIYKYEKLPINFITKDASTDSYYVGNKSNCFEKGYNIGGDNYRYEGVITNYTNSVYLKECDYYLDRQEVIATNDRGECRLVYSVYNGVKVFYTEDHYESFTKRTKFEINLASNILKMVSAVFLIGDGAYIFWIFKPKYIYKKEEYLEADVIE